MREATSGRIGYAALAFLLGLFSVAAAAPAQDRSVTVRGSRPASTDVSELDVSVRYAAGRFDVGLASEGQLYEYRITYDEEIFRPLTQWSVQDGVGQLRVGIRKPDGAEPQPSWWRRLLNLNLDLDFDDVDPEDGHLDLRLSPESPTRLDVEMGAAEGRLELGGLSLTEIDMSTGATDTELVFEEPNRVDMEQLRVEAGAAAFRASGLGNARAGDMSFRGGVGDLRLDFTGEWSRDADASVEMAMGTLRLVFPRSLGVRIHRDGFLTSVDAPGFLNTEGGGLETTNWSSAEHRLELTIRTALGSVEIDRVH